MSLLDALETAIAKETTIAASIFVPPKNSRGTKCKVSGCARPAYAKDFCNAHYIRNRFGRALDIPVRARKRLDKCAECGGETGAKGGWGLCTKHYRAKRKTVLKAAAIEVMGGVCAICKKKYHAAVFDFHHLGEKTESPSFMFASSSLESIAKELEGCMLLCANCHRMLHWATDNE